MWWAIARAIGKGAARGGKALGRGASTAARATGRTAGRALGATGRGVGYVAKNPIQSLYTAGWAIDAVKNFGKDFLPRASVAIRVSVQGSFWANINNLFALACGIAFRRFPGDNEGFYNSAFKADIDWKEKIVTVELAYVASALSGQVMGGATEGLLNKIKGPIPRVLGWIDKFPKWMGGGDLPVQGIDASLFNGDEAQIFAGAKKPTLSHFRGENPPPAFDGISRSSDFTAILLQQLTNPCEQIPKPVLESYTTDFADGGVTYSGETDFDAIYNKRSLQVEGSAVNPIKQGAES